MAAAVRLGGWASRLSRGFGRDGAVIGGRVTLAVDPGSLGRLAAGRRIALVSGTNGKTTTTAFLARALRTCGPVATNATGANMPDGLVSALLRQPEAPFAALEVDEGYLAGTCTTLRPEVVALLNLTRDQLDRVGEVRKVEASIRRILASRPDTLVVANADDPMVVAAASGSPRTVWVSVGGCWRHDAAACPLCGSQIVRNDATWWCQCGLRRPPADWTVTGSGVTGPDGTTSQLQVRLPGAINRANAVFALAAATVLGASRSAAADAIASVTDVAGRYRIVQVGGRRVRLLLAKNPAGWTETLRLLDHPARGVVLAVDGQEADGRDLSWLWDVPFEQLHGRNVVISGGRAADLAVRLVYAGVRYAQVDGLWDAVEASPADDIDLIGTYSCFHRLGRRLLDAR